MRNELGEKRRITAMIVDDEPDIRLLVRLVMEAADVEIVAEASSGEEAVAMFDDAHPDFVVLDVRMPGMDGIECAHLIRAGHPNQALVFCTAAANESEVGSLAGFAGEMCVSKNDLMHLPEIVARLLPA